MRPFSEFLHGDGAIKIGIGFFDVLSFYQFERFVLTSLNENLFGGGKIEIFFHIAPKFGTAYDYHGIKYLMYIIMYKNMKIPLIRHKDSGKKLPSPPVSREKPGNINPEAARNGLQKQVQKR